LIRFGKGKGRDVTEDSGEAKRARNEVAFRDANDDIRAIIDRHGVDAATVPFLCECGDPACRELIRVPLDKYGEVRAFPRRFLYAASHGRRDGRDGRAVEAHDGYLVIEKTGIAGEIAEERSGEAQHG
jgi:hypothetical protein